MFRPTEIISKVEMRQKINQVSMKKGSGQNISFEKLASIKDQCVEIGSLEEVDLISIVLDVDSDEYQVPI
jgi:hypothetical protein